MPLHYTNYMTFPIFFTLSLLAITAGGVISAFTARKPSRLTSWVSAYLVLVVGIIQFGLVSLWNQLGQPGDTITLLAFIAYNLGNLAVVIGTILKRKAALVNLGGMLIALAMVLFLTIPWGTKLSWALIGWIALAVVILVSMPIGLVLSSLRRSTLQ